MARMIIRGSDKLGDMFETMGLEATKIAKVALYDGVDVMLKALIEAIESLPEETSGRPYSGLLPEDKEDMLESLGVARFDMDRNVVDTHITVEGYTRRTEKQYPKGVPVAMLARSLESGSSVRAKHPFIRPAAREAKPKVLAAIQAKMDEQIELITNGKK